MKKTKTRHLRNLGVRPRPSRTPPIGKNQPEFFRHDSPYRHLCPDAHHHKG